MRTQGHDWEFLDSQVSVIVISDSDSDTDTDTVIETVTPRAAGTANSKAGLIEDTELFHKIFNKIYEQYQKGYTTEGIGQLSAKLVSVIPQQKSAETPATKTEPAADLIAKCLVALGLDTDTDIAKLQDGVVEIALVGSNLNCSLSLEKGHTLKDKRETEKELCG